MNNPDEFETFKKEIRSLLITFKNGCSLFEFKNQYKTMIGRDLPFTQFGFKSEVDLFYSIPDVAQITPTSRDYHLKVVVDQTTKHILKLVSKQKSHKQLSASPLRFVAPPFGFHKPYSSSSHVERKVYMKRKLPQSLVNEITYLIHKSPVGQILQDIPKMYCFFYKKELSFTTYGFSTLENFLRTIPELIWRKIDNDIFVFGSPQAADNFTRSLKKNISRDKPEIVFSTSKENCKPTQHKMDCLDGFNLKLCKEQETFSKTEKFRNDPIEFFPPGAFSPLNQYCQQRLPTRLVSGSFFPAYVSNIFNPGHMYIQLADKEQALSDMNHALEEFYSGSESTTFVMKDAHILAGSVGVAQWLVDMHWYRIKVMSVLSEDSVKVFFVDYGTVDVVSKTLLRYVREDFANFSTQAMLASLSYIKPPRGFHNWSQKATDRILELCLDECVKARVEDIEDDVLSVILYNKNNIYINGALLDSHLAQSTSADKNCPEPVDVPEIVSSNIDKPLFKSPPAFNTFSSKTWEPLPSTSQASQTPHDKPSACENFYEPFEAASTSVITPITSPKSQMIPDEVFLLKTSSPPKEAASNLCSSSFSGNSEVFDDDDDAFFEEFYQKVSIVNKRYVKRIKTNDGYVFHILIYKSKPYVSCGDISHLIWSNKNSDILLLRLQNNGSLLTEVVLWEDENVNMFHQLQRFHVKGFKVLNDRTYLLIISLNNLIEILNIFGHPSAELRTKIFHEYSSFNPNHPIWKEISEVEFSDHKDEEFLLRTDDEKLNRLCLYDLQVMRQNIHMRYQKLQTQKSCNSESVSEEEQRLLALHQKILQRIKEIHQICSNFSQT